MAPTKINNPNPKNNPLNYHHHTFSNNNTIKTNNTNNYKLIAKISVTHHLKPKSKNKLLTIQIFIHSIYSILQSNCMRTNWIIKRKIKKNSLLKDN
jgi:hypothetical protein